jgi:hypothetical protein
MHVLYQQGKITKAELNEFTQGVDYKKLPVKHPKKRGKRGAQRGGE